MFVEFFFSFIVDFVLFGTTPSCAKGSLLALHSGIISDSVLETLLSSGFLAVVSGYYSGPLIPFLLGLLKLSFSFVSTSYNSKIRCLFKILIVILSSIWYISLYFHHLFYDMEDFTFGIISFIFPNFANY